MKINDFITSRNDIIFHFGSFVIINILRHLPEVWICAELILHSLWTGGRKPNNLFENYASGEFRNTILHLGNVVERIINIQFKQNENSIKEMETCKSGLLLLAH